MTQNGQGAAEVPTAVIDAITLSQVSHTFGDGVQALEGIELRVPRGEFLSLTGPSGCGKTTVLRLIAGLLAPTSGTVSVKDGEPARAEGVACCFQDPRLLPWRSVRRNVELPLELLGVEAAQRRERALEALERLNTAEHLKHLKHWNA